MGGEEDTSRRMKKGARLRRAAKKGVKSSQLPLWAPGAEPHGGTLGGNEEHVPRSYPTQEARECVFVLQNLSGVRQGLPPEATDSPTFQDCPLGSQEHASRHENAVWGCWKTSWWALRWSPVGEGRGTSSIYTTR